MTEIDIWEKVFEKLGLKFIEESYNRQCDTNILIFHEYDYSGKKISQYSIYFKLKTGQVTYLYHYVCQRRTYQTGLGKKIFLSKYKDLFREVKLTTIIE